MKHPKLMDAIGQVNDHLILEAERTTRLSSRHSPIPWKKIGVNAAAVAVLIGLGAGIVQLMQSPQFYTSSSSTSSSMDMADAAAPVDQEGSATEAGTAAGAQDTTAADQAEIPENNQTSSESAEESTQEDASDSTEEAAQPVSPLTKPPTITVAGTELTLSSASYSWTIEENGEASTTVACGLAAYQMEGSIATLTGWDLDWIDFNFDQTDFISLTAVADSSDSWGAEDPESISLETDGTVVYLPDSVSDWILSVYITWEGDGYSGSAEYALFVTPTDS